MVSDAKSESGLDVVPPRGRLEPVEFRQHKQHPDLAGVRSLPEHRLENVSVVGAGELPGRTEADSPGRHLIDPLDHPSPPSLAQTGFKHLPIELQAKAHRPSRRPLATGGRKSAPTRSRARAAPPTAHVPRPRDEAGSG